MAEIINDDIENYSKNITKLKDRFPIRFLLKMKNYLLDYYIKIKLHGRIDGQK